MKRKTALVLALTAAVGLAIPLVLVLKKKK